MFGYKPDCGLTAPQSPSPKVAHTLPAYVAERRAFHHRLRKYTSTTLSSASTIASVRQTATGLRSIRGRGRS